MTRAACVQLSEHGDSHREMHRSPGCSLPRHIELSPDPERSTCFSPPWTACGSLRQADEAADRPAGISADRRAVAQAVHEEVEETAGQVALVGFPGDERHPTQTHQHVHGIEVRADHFFRGACRQECR